MIIFNSNFSKIGYRVSKLMGEYSIQNEMTAEQFDQLHALSQKMWWSADRTKEELSTMLKHCIPFAAVDTSSQRLVGFARVLTDGIRYGYIYDVMTEESLRGIGIGKMLMQTILTYPQLSHVKYLELTCAQDMVDYYKIFGFTNDFKNVVAMRFSR
jgi:ribosomal protein S18 acetylase RimI-like enzyme